MMGVVFSGDCGLEEVDKLCPTFDHGSNSSIHVLYKSRDSLHADFNTQIVLHSQARSSTHSKGLRPSLASPLTPSD